ncbi:MAG: U32 family peptidase, partial [Ruthenibacterium sp.]
MLHAAVLAGADAVYLGLEQFSARRTAGNFTIAALRQAVEFCHARGVRVHVALNTVLYPAEVPDMAQTIAAVAEAGADAVIAQDMAVVSLVRTMAPSLALHASTQMSVHTLEGARQLAELGVARVILARELSLAEIAHIAQHCGIETEVFVHGALCMSVSGQCYMSAFLGGRSGNRGACAGPCRLPFEAGAAQRAENSTKAADFAAANGAHHLSLKDMSHIALLPQLAAAGVCSVKIEGRLRTPEYAAAAVNACRQSLAGQPFDAALLQTVFSRAGFTQGYLAGRIDGDMFGMRTGEDAAAAREALPRLRELFRRETPRVPVQMQAHLEADGAKLTVTDADGNRAVTYSGLDAATTETTAVQPQPAQKDQTENIQKALAKTGGTPFYPEQPAAVDGGAWFLPASEWNEMRRAALETLLQKRSAPHARPCLSPQASQVTALLAAQSHADVPCKKLFVQFETLAQMPAQWMENAAALPEGVIVPLSEWQRVPERLRAVTWLALPRWAAAKDAEQRQAAEVQASAAQGFAGYFVQNLAHIRLCRGLPMFGGFGLNITNAVAAAAYAQLGVCVLTL